MGRFARRGGATVGLGEFEPQPFEGRIEFRDVRGGRSFTRAGIGQAHARRLDGLAKRPVALGELDLLPAAQLFAQPPVAAGLGRLAFERAALLLHLENDVVDTREVLLRGLELQLRGAPAALVLRDPGRFLDQLAPIGRAAR